MKVLKIAGIIALVLIGVIGLFFGSGYLITIGDYSVPETVEHNTELPRINVSGRTYHGETYGEASSPVVITLHGGPGGDYRSIQSLKALSDSYFVVFYDQRGSGLSPRMDASELTVDDFVSELNTIVEHYGNGRPVHLVGHSWGAMLASLYIGRYPDKVDRVVLAEPGFLAPEFAEEFLKETRMGFSFRLLGYFLRTKFEVMHLEGPDEHARDDYFVHHLNLYDGPDHPQAGYMIPGHVPNPKGSWRFGARAADQLVAEAFDENGRLQVDFTAGVESIDRQILFLTGEHQRVIGEEYQRRQMELFNDARIVVIPDAGHEMFAENPAAAVSAVRRYLDESVIR